MNQMTFYYVIQLKSSLFSSPYDYYSKIASVNTIAPQIIRLVILSVQNLERCNK